MKHDCINLLDQDGIEFAIGFDYDKQWFPDEDDAPYWYIELQSAEVIIKGVGIDIMPSLNEKQQRHIAQLVSEQLDREEAHRQKYPLNHF